MTAEGRDQGNLRFANPSELAPPPGYTHVVEASGGRTVYLSGQVALDVSGEMVGIGDLRAQTRQVFENLKVALGALGAGFGDVVKPDLLRGGPLLGRRSPALGARRVRGY
jgi:enamine deaminase RidA (YjgF/YER057c/UK114 family)